MASVGACWRLLASNGPTVFLNLFFLISGQKLNNNQVEALAKLGPDAPWHQRVLVKHRRLIGILIPFLFFQISWWLLAYRWNLWTLFPERWILSVTMIFGASVAGKIMYTV